MKTSLAAHMNCSCMLLGAPWLRLSGILFGLVVAVCMGSFRHASGDVILSLDYEPAHRQRGVERSVAMGGNVGGVEYMKDTGPSLASATMFNRNGRGFALSAGHVGVFSTFTFFTGWDTVNNRGLEYKPVNVEVFPGYSLGMNPLGSVADVALFTFDGLIAGAPDLVFPDAPISQGSTLFHGGFGEFGIWGEVPIGKDGKARAGSAVALNTAFINGATSDTYFMAVLDLNDPNSSRGTVGSSGSPGQVLSDGINYTNGIVTHGSISLIGTRTQFARTDLGNTAFHSWFNDRISAATSSVPEPSSAALLFTSIGIYATVRRRNKRQVSASTPQAVTTSRP